MGMGEGRARRDRGIDRARQPRRARCRSRTTRAGASRLECGAEMSPARANGSDWALLGRRRAPGGVKVGYKNAHKAESGTE